MKREFGTDFEVAELVGLPVIVIRRLAKRGDLPGVIRIGRHTRFNLAKIRAFLEDGGVSPVLSPGNRSTDVVGK